MTNWALIIGIESYAKPLDKLEASLVDAQHIRSRLLEFFDFSHQRIISLPNASKGQILHVINERMSKWDVRHPDQLFVFFAGHGMVRKSKGKKSWYLVPSDGKTLQRKKSKNTHWDWDSFISLPDFLKINDAFHGKHILYIFDSCHSGFAVRAQPRGQDKSCSILVAATARQRVVDSPLGEKHSILSATILDALSGWGALDEKIHPDFSAGDLRDFVKREAARRIRQRLPLVNMTPFGTDMPTVDGELFMFHPLSARLPWRTLFQITSPVVEDRKAGVSSLAEVDDDDMLALRDQAFERILREEESPTVLATALYHIGLIGGTRFFELIGEKFDSESLVVMRAAIKSLVNLALRHDGIRKRTIEKLKGLFKDPQIESLRILIDESLARLKDPGGTKRTLDRIQDSGSSVRHRGLNALQPTAELIRDLLSTLERGVDWRECRLAAEVLGRFGVGRAAEPLIERAKNPAEHWLVRYAAVEALGQIASHIDSGAGQSLTSILTYDRSLNVRTATAECLGIVPPDVIDAERFLVSALKTDPEWRVRRAAAEALAMSLKTGALEELVDALRDEHFRVRKEAISAIGELTTMSGRAMNVNASSSQALRASAQDDASEYVRRAANHELNKKAE